MELVMTKFRTEGGMGIITLNSPKTLNAFDGDMNPELLYLLNYVERDPKVRVVIIEGLEKAFCAGGNLKVFYNEYKEKGRLELDELVIQAAQIASTIKKMGKLVITSISGTAAGAGANLALAGDFVLAAENVKISQAFANVGLATDTGGAFLLCRAIGSQRAMELCISGRELCAQEAKELGLVNEVYPVDALQECTMEFAKKLVAGPTKAYANIKRQIYAATYADYDAYLHTVEIPLQCASMKTRDFEKAICSFVEKIPLVFSGE